jgi:site-specific DNA-methyltransferase (adenine-specific)
VGDTVLDPFLGSGTTTKVARDLGRNSIGYEINSDYLPVIKQKVDWGKQILRPADARIRYEIMMQEESKREILA